MSTDAWENQYKLANKVVHATPQGTFDRLGVPSGPRTFTPVSHSDYGLAPPAINAAIFAFYDCRQTILDLFQWRFDRIYTSTNQMGKSYQRILYRD